MREVVDVWFSSGEVDVCCCNYYLCRSRYQVLFLALNDSLSTSSTLCFIWYIYVLVCYFNEIFNNLLCSRDCVLREVAEGQVSSQWLSNIHCHLHSPLRIVMCTCMMFVAFRHSWLNFFPPHHLRGAFFVDPCSALSSPRVVVLWLGMMSCMLGSWGGSSFSAPWWNQFIFQGLSSYFRRGYSPTKRPTMSVDSLMEGLLCWFSK